MSCTKTSIRSDTYASLSKDSGRTSEYEDGVREHDEVVCVLLRAVLCACHLLLSVHVLYTPPVYAGPPLFLSRTYGGLAVHTRRSRSDDTVRVLRAMIMCMSSTFILRHRCGCDQRAAALGAPRITTKLGSRRAEYYGG